MRLWFLSNRRPAKANMKYGRRRRVRPKIRNLDHWMTAHARLKNEFTEDEKSHNLMNWLICRLPRAFLRSDDMTKTSLQSSRTKPFVKGAAS